jgi:class 3 adenylate cyclase
LITASVQESAQTHGGRPVKWLGDGVMFPLHRPGKSHHERAGSDRADGKGDLRPARIGINAGAVVAQEGDYFGRTVNIAARIADYARPHEVLVSDDAKRSAGDAEVDFELIGDVPLKGVSAAIRLHKATRVAG